jgi:hypothetical protein
MSPQFYRFVKEALASRKAGPDKWLFELLARDTWPQGTTCDACANLSLLFTTGSRHPSRPSWMVSKNALQHHEMLTELAESSRTCGLCALLLACFKGSPRALFKDMLGRKRESVPDSDAVDDYNVDRYKVRAMVEECYGSGKLIFELRVTMQSVTDIGGDRLAIHIADDTLRVYSEAGMDPAVASK